MVITYEWCWWCVENIMTYNIEIHARYANGDEIKLEFNTKAVLLHDAHTDAQIELFGERGNRQQNPFETPVFLRVNLKPLKE